ncbi:MAG TPA: hypothetical protein VFT15_16015 [Chitinophagaceae bacterium]|nr:hypothetical protein [Chitinophagaceae bacterium]
MKFFLISFIFLFSACSGENQSPKAEKNEYHPTYTTDLEDSIKTLNLQYISWACQCANWATPSDIELYQDTGKLSEHSIFIEPATDKLILPDTLGYSGDLIMFVGQFYKDIGYPKNYPKTEMQVDKARVFKYSSYKVIRSNYRDFELEKSN